ncbi:MAG: ribosome biogenesis GTP-binding protein YihA/YsxC [Rickettsiales bacterium]|nr:ribosome biogenesis GTP-binding protein YihA/YsxC [Pseudomonadota bacterium]MDA0965592.1 ribosome biogenesis GTP-binding protein YihA/YsxC [Pseudomonadota bacterium]MDG4542916.1 ribosome biogenesis GTP-binding protein YihA/YsxC [Rickettsiales bacterium]MDG4544636.1 ribosome biogenesis GTP-binding protein YihA/YsxC [Rickettsiales bacterium]MDG4546758.1 ribosome biogenesis GTP-binding protein YihA/YsxC [Rickettsiales bacterium]
MGYNQTSAEMMNENEDLDIEKGKWLFSGQCDFKIGATELSHIPESDISEVAFAGLSNVGKSSLINAITGRTTLARTSVTPGRTRQLNFFLLRDCLTLVDLPGYGYAKASKKDIKGWTDLTKKYLKGRPNLARVMLLVDSRRGLKDSDRSIMDLLDESAVNYQIILTKSDKVKKLDVEKIISDIKAEAHKHIALHPEVITTSSRKNIGIDTIRAIIASFT